MRLTTIDGAISDRECRLEPECRPLRGLRREFFVFRFQGLGRVRPPLAIAVAPLRGSQTGQCENSQGHTVPGLVGRDLHQFSGDGFDAVRGDRFGRVGESDQERQVAEAVDVAGVALRDGVQRFDRRHVEG